MSWSTYADITKPYLSSQISSDFPYHNWWVNDPLSSKTWIDPHKAGYRPYKKALNIRVQPDFQPSCAVYQYSCDVILPANKCYAANHEIVHQP
jgi:hypothetical protein